MLQSLTVIQGAIHFTCFGNETLPFLWGIIFVPPTLIYSNHHLLDMRFFLSGSLAKSNTGLCSQSDIVWWQFFFMSPSPPHCLIICRNKLRIMSPMRPITPNWGATIVVWLREAIRKRKSQNCGLFPYHYPLFLKLIGNYELRNRDPIGTQHFMK